MLEVTTPAIIYRLIQYSDKSAIALAFSRDHGKLKLFIPKAYSSKGGLLTFVPGTVSFGMKESSDLHRYHSFSHEPSYYRYTQNPDIIMRLHLLFDFFESLFHPGENCGALWKLILKYDDINYRKLFLYSLYRVLREAGAHITADCVCGKEGRWLSEGELKCDACIHHSERQKAYEIDSPTRALLANFPDNDSFRQIEFNLEDEKSLVKLFAEYHKQLSGRESLKSIEVFFSML